MGTAVLLAVTALAASASARVHYDRAFPARSHVFAAEARPTIAVQEE